MDEEQKEEIKKIVNDVACFRKKYCKVIGENDGIRKIKTK